MGSTIALAKAAALEPSFLPAGWEIKVIGGAEDPDAPAPAAQLIDSNESTGEVTAIVGVTGIVDHVGDLIEPGAYKNTLAKRRPKVCWAHSWEAPIGKVLRIEEWQPGDPRFAKVGATLDGKAWPAAAGALVAHMQMNLKSDKGKEAFAAVEFYSKSGECEWSIGWQPIPTQTKRRKDGVRVCKSVELFEVSPVLFGAAPLTRTLEVKALNLHAATRQNLQTRVGLPAGTPGTPAAVPGADVAAGPVNQAAPTPGEADPQDPGTLHRNAMDEIDWDEVDAAAKAVNDNGGQPTPPPAADPEDAGDGGDDETAEGDDPEDAADGGADDATEGDAAPAGKKPLPPWMGKKKGDAGVAVNKKALQQLVDGLELTALTGVVLPDSYQVKASGGADQNRGHAENLRHWYVEGGGAAEIGWGGPDDFDKCVAIASQHMDPERAKGYCNLRHHDATGEYPATHAAQMRGSVAGKAFAAADRLAKSWNPLLEVGAYAAHGRTERKFLADGIDGLAGSFEQRQSKLRDALDPALKRAVGLTPPTGPTSVEAGDGMMASLPNPWNDAWTSIDGTWPDRVVATIMYRDDADGGARERQTFVVPYTFVGDEATLGDPQPVDLKVTIVPSELDADDDAEDATDGGDDEAAEGEDDEGDPDALTAAMLMPTLRLLSVSSDSIKSAFAHSPEVKAGRVMSEANMTRFRAALEHLMEVARAAGIDLPGWTGESNDAQARDEMMPDTTAPQGMGTTSAPARATSPQRLRQNAPTAVKTLSSADLQAQLAALGI